MPRTVDHIVACHKAATALRSAGKPIWNHRISLKPMLWEDPTNEIPKHIADVSVRIAAALRRAVPAKFFNAEDPAFDARFVATVVAMEQCSAKPLVKHTKACGRSAVGTFNVWLEVIYDWADNKRVWID